MGFYLLDGGYLSYGFMIFTKKILVIFVYFESFFYRVLFKIGLIDYD